MNKVNNLFTKKCRNAAFESKQKLNTQQHTPVFLTNASLSLRHRFKDMLQRIWVFIAGKQFIFNALQQNSQGMHL